MGGAAHRAECERLLLAELDRCGTPDRLERSVIVAQLAARGVPASTCYRWIAGIIASGRPGQHVVRAVAAAVAQRAARGVDPASAMARDVAATVPPVPTPEDLAGIGTADNVLAKLGACVRIAEQVVADAQADGKSRNSKVLLAASEHLRRCMDSVVRLHGSLLQMAQIERYQQAVFEVLREEEPQLVARVLRKMRQLGNDLSAESKGQRVAIE